jgi:ABC-2 type transport system permease protein
MFLRIWSLVVKELIQLSRDRVFTPLITLGCLAELLMVGYSTSQGIHHLPLAVVDLDRSQESRQLVSILENSRTFNADYFLSDVSEVTPLLDHGDVAAALIIPCDFSDKLNDSRLGPSQVQALLDGSDPAAAMASLESIEGAVATFGQQKVEVLPQTPGLAAPLDADVRVWFNEELNEADYTTPSEVGFVGAAVALMVASLGIARERERGTLEQMMVTPLRPIEVVIGKAVPAIIVAVIVFQAMLATMLVVFGVPMRGSWPLLLVLMLFYMLVELGWGLMVSSISKSQQQAILLIMVLIMVEMVFSGYAFPVDTMPRPLQVVSDFVAIKHWLIIFRSILLKGAGMRAFWPHLVWLAGIGLVVGAMAVLVLRQQRWE